MKLFLLSDVLHDGKTTPAESIVDVDEKLAEKWIKVGAAKEYKGGEAQTIRSTPAPAGPTAEDIDNL
jgi:hypothetical protein